MSIGDVFAQDRVTIIRTEYVQNDRCEQVCEETVIYSNLWACIYEQKNRFKVTDKERQSDNHTYKIIICGDYCDIKKRDLVDLYDVCGTHLWRYCIDDVSVYRDTFSVVSHLELLVSFYVNEA